MVKKWDYTTEPRAVVLVHADTRITTTRNRRSSATPWPAQSAGGWKKRRCPTALQQTLPLTCCSMRPSPVRSGESRWKPRRVRPRTLPQGVGNSGPRHRADRPFLRAVLRRILPPAGAGQLHRGDNGAGRSCACCRAAPAWHPLLVLTPEMAAETAQTGEAGA